MSSLLPLDLGSSVSASLLGAVLSASLLGSIHCAGMCGPFVAVYSAAGPGRDARPGSKTWAHLAYHGGRAVTYTGLGALAGALGSAMDWAGRAAGFAHVAALLCGVLVILWGAAVLAPSLRIRSPVAKFFAPQLARLGRKPRVFRASVLGALTPFLPCGWLYAFVVTAGGTGSAWGGAALMAVFWAGTVPALLGVGVVLSKIGDRLRPKVPLLTGVALIVVGVLGVTSRLSHPLTPIAPDHESGSPHAVPGQGAKCH